MSYKTNKYKRKNRYRLHNLFAFLLIGIAIYKVMQLKEYKIGWDMFDKITIHNDKHIQMIIIAAIVIFILWFLKKRIKEWRRRKKYRTARMFEIDRMEGKEFEAFLAIYFADLGYRVLDETGGSGDRGGDLLLLSPEGKKVVIQAKRYSGKVPFKAVQEVHTAQSLYGAQKAIIVTNNYFTKQTRETAQKLNIELWDRNLLIENMYAYRKKKKEA